MKLLESILIRIVCFVVVAAVLNVFGIVGVSYLRIVDNNPFTTAVVVKKIDSDQILLADGRIITIIGEVGSEDVIRIRDAGGRIDCEIDPDGVATLYNRRQRTICDLGMPIIRIPLIPRDVPRYDRRYFATGRIARM